MRPGTLEERATVQGKAHEDLLVENQAAAILKLSNRTLQTWRVRGFGPRFIKVGRSVRYRLEDLQEFMNSNVFHSTSEKH